MYYDDDESKIEDDVKKKYISGPIILLILVLISIVGFFVWLVCTAVSNIQDRWDSRYVSSESEIVSFVNSYYCDAVLLDSVFVKDPEPQRICTFKDEEHGFTFTAVSKRGPLNQLTLIPPYMPRTDSDYEVVFYSWIEEKLKPVLDNEGIELFQYSSADDEDNVRRFSFRQRALITTYDREYRDKKFIMDTINSYGLPIYFNDYDIEVYCYEDFSGPAFDGGALTVFDDEEEVDSGPAFDGGALTVFDDEEEVDKKELDERIIDIFGLCAMYLPKDADIKGGRPLSSKEYEDIKNFLFYLRCNEGSSGQRLDPETLEENSSYVYFSYENWSYMLKEVYGEEHPEDIKAMLEEGFNGEQSVYYNPDEDRVYSEAGKITLFELFTRVKNVENEEDKFIITYDVYSIHSYNDGPMDTVEITIEERTDNIYGYKLISIK